MKNSSKSKNRTAWLPAIAILVVIFTGIALAQAPPSGYLIAPDHHEGVVGVNDIPVTATSLEDGVRYKIMMTASYHPNPRTPPGQGDTPPEGYTESNDPWYSDGNDLTHTFVVPLPDCHWQLSADFTLHYWTGEYWHWNGDDRASQSVDIWYDCVHKIYLPLILKD